MVMLENIINKVDAWLWGPWLLVLLLGTHLFMTFRTGLVQRRLGMGIRLSVGKDPDGKGDISQFGALTTALASTIGTGNIIGVGTAIALGGPGAVLWMWLTGVFGIATKYSESLIAVKYRVKSENGSMIGGAMYALERGLKMRWLGIIFALIVAFCAFGIGASVQSNAVAKLMNETFEVPTWVVGLIITALTALVILGGLKSIERVCVALVPFMAFLYIIGCLILLFVNRHALIPSIKLICSSAFEAKAIGGGFIASTLMSAARYGVARGLFSNEAGMGSAPIVAAAARTRNPVRQALVSSTGVFWDTVVICLLTGLVVVSSVIGNPDIVAVSESRFDGSVLVHTAFGQIPLIGSIVLTFGLLTFAFSTILGWSYYGEMGLSYLLGPKCAIPYRIVYIAATFCGTILALDLVWTLADALNALMAIPNLIAVLLLSPVIARETRKYLHKERINDIDETPIPLRTELRK